MYFFTSHLLLLTEFFKKQMVNTMQYTAFEQVQCSFKVKLLKPAVP